MNVMYDVVDVNVLLIIEMRDEMLVAALSHLMLDSWLLKIHVQASKQTRQIRRECNDDDNNKNSNNSRSNLMILNYCLSLIFDNDMIENEMTKRFVEHCLFFFFHENLQRLINMMRSIPDFSRSSVKFCHMLDIFQQSSELTLCMSLLQTHFIDDWIKVDAMMCCKIDDFVYASTLISRIDMLLMLIREADKLSSLIVSVIKLLSHILSLSFNNLKKKRIKMKQDVILRNASVMMMNDVLFAEKMLCAMLQLLDEADIDVKNVSIMIMIEFSIHHDWKLLHQREYDRINIQSLLIFDDA